MDKKYIVLETKMGEDDFYILGSFATLREAFIFLRENPSMRKLAKLIDVEIIEK